jgi:hypothetical protein
VQWLIFNGESILGTMSNENRVDASHNNSGCKELLLDFLAFSYSFFLFMNNSTDSFLYTCMVFKFPPLHCYLPGISSISSPYGITGFCFDRVGLTITRNISREEKINKK